MLSRCFFSLSLFLLLFPSFLLIPQPASAAAFGLVPCALQEDNPDTTSWDERKPCTLCHFLIGMNFVVKFLRNLMTAIAIAIMVAMAIMYIVSAGNEDMMATAKKGIIGSLIGIVVILLAWVIVNFIFTLPIFANNGLVRTDGSWDTFTCNTTSQSGWAGTRNTSGIGNGTGSAGSGQPGREGLPGSTPGGGGGNGGGGNGGGSTCGNGSCSSGETCATCPECCTSTGGACNNNGTCNAGETCSNCESDCGSCPPTIPDPMCGSAHYSCEVGTPMNTEELGDRWVWTCNEDWKQLFCRQLKAGCGNNVVEAGEECDTGGKLTWATCESGSTCDIYCKVCNGGTWGCGPSHQSGSIPTEPLCVGAGVTASSVTTESYYSGNGTRYRWTCTKGGSEKMCYSDYIISAGVCGSAAGVPSATAPSTNLCSSGTLSYAGVLPAVDPTNGSEIWYWYCNGFSTNALCTAPKNSSSGYCAPGSYSWTIGSRTCIWTYSLISNGNTKSVSINEGPGGVSGMTTLLCTNGSVSHIGSITCIQNP